MQTYDMFNDTSRKRRDQLLTLPDDMPCLEKPYPQAQWIGKPVYETVMRLNIRSINTPEYIKEKEIPNHTLETFTRYNGKSITINTDCIIRAETFTMATVQADVSEWDKLRKPTPQNHIKTYYVIIEPGQILTLET